MNGKIYLYFNEKKYNETGIKSYYVGQTVKTIEARAGLNGSNYLNNPESKFCRAIKKWGWDAFTVSILVENIQTYEELNMLEIKYIEEYNSYNDGYNSNLGGGSQNGFKFSEESRKKMSDAKKGMFVGDKNPMYGVKMSEESRKKMSDAKKGKPNGRKGNFKHTEETKQKIRDTIAKKGHHQTGKALSEEHRKHIQETNSKKYGKKVFCPELDKIFNTTTEASKFLLEEYNCKSGKNISAVCNGKRPYCGKILLNNEIIKLTWKYVDESHETSSPTTTERERHDI